MAPAQKVAAAAMTVALYCGYMANAVDYEVGGSAGWSTAAHVDYQKWAATKDFHVGDNLLFDYNKTEHNVLRVTHENFRDCDSSAPLAIYNTGNDSVPISGRGHLYFICGFPNHCLEGQDIDIRIAGSPNSSGKSTTAAPADSPSDAGQPHHNLHDNAPSSHGSLGIVGLVVVVLIASMGAR